MSNGFIASGAKKNPEIFFGAKFQNPSPGVNRRSRKRELREFGVDFSLKRAPALRSEILSGEFGREGHLLQSPLTQGVLQAAIKKSGPKGWPGQMDRLGWQF